MFTNRDLKQISEHGISVENVNEQLKRFITGFPALQVMAPAAINEGIVYLSETEKTECIYTWEEFLLKGGTVEKFVPASGAASRMFKNLFSFLSSDSNVPIDDFEKIFFEEIHKFPFFMSLDDVCHKITGMGVDDLIDSGNYKDVVRALLLPEGLNYGNLPKGVLLFHKNQADIHTAVEEHLEEGAQYACDKNKMVNVHFTVSPEHKILFERLLQNIVPTYENMYGIKYNITMSEQKASTDTIAVNLDNTPFRNDDGSLLFRPSGHGALIENLNERDVDVLFIKNIDNVVPARNREITLKYKKIIGGYLIILQRQISKYIKLFESGNYTIEDLRGAIHFLHDKLNIRYSKTKNLDDSELVSYVLRKLRRPIRVCGVVRNDGEAGGGPFIAVNPDSSTSPQILESSQFDANSPESLAMLKSASHFNPVDLVCYIKNNDGKKYDLRKYVDVDTGFISTKSKDGKDLKALELPGLWNGAMSDWNTVFIEVPIETFNPVKTVNDLLRPMHQ